MTDTLADPWSVAADMIDPAKNALWTPWPKQELATNLSEQSDELLFGGAAGPGKTEWLIQDAIRNMEEHRNNYGVIFRRVFPSLRRTIIPRLRAALPEGRAHYNKTEHTFYFPNGSVLECASLQYEDTVTDWQGAELGWVGWEELTEFMQTQYEFILGRLRAPADGIRPRSVATTNPGGNGHRWVKRRFVKPNPDEDLDDDTPMPKSGVIWRPRFDPTIHDEKNPPLRRVYVAAVYTDNPTLLQRDPAYLSKLRANSSKALRLALETGDWDAIDAIDGALWRGEDIEGGRIQTVRFRQKIQTLRRLIGVDPSSGGEGGDGYGVSVCSRGMDGIGYVEAAYEWKNLSVLTLARKTFQLMHDVGADGIVLERNHGAKWLLEVFRKEDPYANVIDVWASDNKRTRAEPVAALFEYREDIELPYRARIVGNLTELEEQLTTTTFKAGDLSPDMLDAMVWAMTELMLRGGDLAQEEMLDDRLRGRR
jgi:hypothetical protein